MCRSTSPRPTWRQPRYLRDAAAVRRQAGERPSRTLTSTALKASLQRSAGAAAEAASSARRCRSSPTRRSDPSRQGRPDSCRPRTSHSAPATCSPIAEPNFYPEIDLANVGIKPVQKLLAQPNFLAEVDIPGFLRPARVRPAATNAGQVFLQLTSALPLAFGGKPNQRQERRARCAGQPQMNLLGLSKVDGAGGRTERRAASTMSARRSATVADGAVRPARLLRRRHAAGRYQARRHRSSPALSLAGAEVPKLLTRDFPDRVEASFDWNTDRRRTATAATC